MIIIASKRGHLQLTLITTKVSLNVNLSGKLSRCQDQKKWLILGVSLTHLVESRDLFLLEADIVDNIFQWDVLKNMWQIKCYNDMFHAIRALIV